MVSNWSQAAMASSVSLQLTAIASKGSSDGLCGGEDWISFRNVGVAEVDLIGFVLHESKGAEDEDAFTFCKLPVLAFTFC
jgi:hypothetical protein